MNLICLTCNNEGPMESIACGHWSYCRNFAQARASGTLPDPMPKIGGGPAPGDCSKDR